MDFFGFTEKGLRNSNQDAFMFGTQTVSCTESATRGPQSFTDCGPFFCAVADGLGGHRDGEVASSLAVVNLADQGVFPHEPDSTWLKSKILEINQKILSQGGGAPGAMGTTLTGMLVLGDHGLIFNCGDSRVYRFRQGQFEVLTIDHRIGRHTLSSCLGGGVSMPQVDIQSVLFEKGDLFLLASDGLFEELTDADLKDFGRGAYDLRALGGKILNKARVSSTDNMTGVLALVN